MHGNKKYPKTLKAIQWNLHAFTEADINLLGINQSVYSSHFFLVTSCWTLPFFTKQCIYKTGTRMLNSNSPNSYQWNRRNTCRKPNGPQQKSRKLDTERTGNEMHISHASNPLVTTHTRHQLKESMVCNVRSMPCLWIEVRPHVCEVLRH